MIGKKIVVIGAGGIGLYFGGRLAQKGLKVFFVAKGETKKALLEKGLRVDSINGDFTVNPVQVIEDVSTFGQADLILVCVKTYQIKDIFPVLKPLVGKKTLVMPLENGIDAPKILGKEISSDNIIGGLCKISSYKVEPGYIKHVSYEPSVEFGELQKPISPRITELQKTFEFAGIKTKIHDDFLTPYWMKMIFICVMSGIGSITRMPVGSFRAVPETRELVIHALEECVVVARKSGANINADAVDKTLKVIDGLPPQATSSMQKDIMNGLPSELEEQNGTIYRLGKELGVETPINKFIFSSLLPMELEARKKHQP